jgi:hypothetical protein
VSGKFPLAWVRWGRLGLVLLICVGLAGGGTWTPQGIGERAGWFASASLFDFGGWTLDAVALKVAQSTLHEESYLNSRQLHQLVEQHFRLMGQILDLQGEIADIYADPSRPKPSQVTEPLRNHLQQLQSQAASQETTVEAVLQEQVAYELALQGFAAGGQVLPPVLFHLSAVPLALIVSPREVIREDASLELNPDLPLDEQVNLEDRVAQQLGVSTLVVPIGGIGTYPTMIEKTSSLNWTAETIAHEWTHDYLGLRPLGWNYDASSQMRTINETVADIVGTEIGRQVIAQFYPDLVPPPPAPSAPGLPILAPPAFDFQKEMRSTRVQVDQLLAEGKIDEAESYMATQRLVFVQHGFSIRKLNQAYFAFYGAYADQPGQRGSDPVGPAVEALFQRSRSLGDFLRTAATISSYSELMRLVGWG